MKKILAFGASNSRKSINKTLATYVANKLDNVTITVADLNDYTLPLYSPDLEEMNGIPENAHKFDNLIAATDAIVLSLAEYNGMPTAAFVNLFDWLSRIDQKVWKNKPLFLMATSPGGRGGASVLNIQKNLLPHFDGNVITDFSLPKFYDNFKEGKLVDTELEEILNGKINAFQKAIQFSYRNK